MKITEAGMFQDMLGQLGSTAGQIGRGFMGTPDVGKKADALAKKMFIEKFIRRGKDALDAAVKQGLIDLNAPMKSTDASQDQPDPASAQPAATGTVQPASSPAQPRATRPGQPGPGVKPQIDVNADAAVKAMRTFQPTGTKPLPANIAAELNKDLQYVSKNKDYFLRAANKIQKFNKAGYDMKPYYKSFMAQYALGKKQQTIQEERLQELYLKLITEDSLVEELKNRGYDTNILIKNIEDLFERYHISEVSPQGGGRVAGAGLSQTPNAVRKRQARAAAKAAGGAAQPGARPAAQPAAQPGARPAAQPAAANPASGGTSLGDWFKENFIKDFLEGVPWNRAEPQINQILTNMAVNYPKNVASGLTSLAEIGWAVSPKMYDPSGGRSRY